MKISIITAVYNRVETICRSLESVKAQDYSDIQHIVIDGLSNDGTIDQVKKCMPEGTVFVSEADRGVYDALNKGLNLADGEIVGFLHSDDVFAGSDVLTKVARQFEDSSVEAVYGDAVFFNSKVPEKIIRRYSSARFRASLLGWGWMPAHTTLFLRRGVYQKFGNFDISYRIAADYEFICRIFGSGELNSRYIPEVMVKMQIGGLSTGGFRSSMILNREVMRACRNNNIATNWPMILSKYPLKLLEFIQR